MSPKPLSSIDTNTYPGSLFFEPLSQKVGLPIDQLNFIISHLTSLILALFYQRYVSHSQLSITFRHYCLLVPGFFITYFSFGYQMGNLVVLSMICYIAICTCNPCCVHIVVLFISMLYLACLHLLRQIHDYGNYILDITGPSMIVVQKVTSLGFCLYDGLACPPEKLTREQSNYRMIKRPSFLEFFSYIFQFLNISCGPLVYYNDYIEFVEGTNFKKHSSLRSPPSPLYTVVEKLTPSVLSALLLVKFSPIYPITRLADQKYLDTTSFFEILIYMMLTTMITRTKYYHAWKFGEAICNAAGLGFNGYDDNGNAKWDLINSVEIIRFEFSTNLKSALDSWNKTTQTWLRRCAYERTYFAPTLCTYILSAFWHGFYPGYYLTFLTGALFTHGARLVRRKCRTRFIKLIGQFPYDVVTCLVTRVIMAYIVFPFVLLSFTDCWKIYKRIYFFGHVLVLMAIFLCSVF